MSLSWLPSYIISSNLSQKPSACLMSLLWRHILKAHFFSSSQRSQIAFTASKIVCSRAPDRKIQTAATVAALLFLRLRTQGKVVVSSSFVFPLWPLSFQIPPFHHKSGWESPLRICILFLLMFSSSPCCPSLWASPVLPTFFFLILVLNIWLPKTLQILTES